MRPTPVLKRLFDLLISILLLILLSPLLLVLYLLVWIKLGWPAIFTQERPGKGEKIFRLYKFRTMREVYDSLGIPLPDDKRLTPLGRFLRSSSLDELPELVNVIKGEMSLVGPRPLLIAYLDRYTREQARRHEVLPGITGWAQVNGRNAISWEDKFTLDVWYVDHWSFCLDIRILFLTLGKAFKQESINAPGSPSAPIFMGSDHSKEE